MSYVENHNGFHLMENNIKMQVKLTSARVATSRSVLTQNCHHILEHSLDNLIKPCEDSPKETDNISTLDLDNNLNLDDNLDLNNNLDLVAINKIKKFRPVDKKVKSDKEEDSYPLF